MPAATIAESDVGNSLDAEAVIQRITPLHPPDQLSRPAVAFDSHGLHQKRPAGRHADDRPFVRRSHAGPDRRRVPARDRLSPAGTQTGMTNLVEIDQPQHPLHRRAHRACRERSLALARRRRGARPARRIRFGQERHLACADAAVAEEADADFRQRQGAGPRRAGAGRRGAVGVSRPDRLDDLSGAGAGARSRLHHRPADRRNRDAP